MLYQTNPPNPKAGIPPSFLAITNYYRYIQSMLAVNTNDATLAARLAFDNAQSLRLAAKDLTPSELTLLQIWESFYSSKLYPKP
jgi:hypothetical protein